jgi:hypothetical protein
MEKLIECTEAEMREFIAAYPRKLEADVLGTYEPPLVTFNDFTLGKWPESVVASYSAGDEPNTTVPFYGPASGFRKLAPQEDAP